MTHDIYGQAAIERRLRIISGRAGEYLFTQRGALAAPPRVERQGGIAAEANDKIDGLLQQKSKPRSTDELAIGD